MVFGRRQQPQVRNAPPTAAAQTAASQAFLASRASNASLSNAAATAALRSFTASPTPVGQIQTKRMQRRGSTSSHGSAGSGRRPLSRQNSSGSMTERTFRDPSPNRPPSRGGAVYHDNPPPMPALPRAYASPPPSVTSRSKNRSASTEPPQRISSPPPKSGGRGVSVDRGPGIMTRPAKTRDVTLRNLPNIDTNSNQSSVNFSRPMSPQYQFTPPDSPLQTKPTLASKPRVSANSAQPRLSSAEAAQIQYQVSSASTAPTKKKKRTVDSSATQGSHLAAGGMGGRPMGTAVDRVASPTPVEPSNRITSPKFTASPSPASTAQSSPASIPKKKKKQPTQNITDTHQSGNASDSDAPSERSASSDRPRQFNTRAAGLLTKQPSVVREDREAEEKEEMNMKRKASRIPVVPTETPNDAEHTSMVPKAVDAPAKRQEPTIATTWTAPSLAAVATTPRAQPADQEIKAVKRTSLSPSAASRIPGSPTVAAFDGSRHQPPPRSVSPAKSALKNYRGVSPAGVVPGGWGVAPSETSDISSVVSDDGYKNLLAPRKRKNVRVSFEDEPVIVGRSTSPPRSPESPVMFSPQDKSGKKGWFGIRGKKGASMSESETEDGMQPMPTLPSFGSMRKSREEEQNALSQEILAPPRRFERHEGSRDHAVGGIIAQDHAKMANETSTAATPTPISNEPMAPEVTSVEGSGYHSDSGSGVEDLAEPQAIVEPQEAAREPEPKPLPVETPGSVVDPDAQNRPVTQPTTQLLENAVQTPERPERPERPVQPVQNLAPVPQIQIQPSTPKSGDSVRNPIEAWLGMPGGFPVSTDTLVEAPASHEVLSRAEDRGNSPSISAHEHITAHHATDPTPADLGISEPDQDQAHAAHPPPGTVADLIRHQTSHHDDAQTNDSDSIYSDAAEDLSDLEGDGFGSINAIMESPEFSPIKPSHESPTISPENIGIPAKALEQTQAAAPSSEESWDKAQAHWASVSQSRQKPVDSVLAEPTSYEEPRELAAAQTTTKPRKKRSSAQAPGVQSALPKAALPIAAAVPVTARQHRQTPSNTSDQSSLRKSMRGPQSSPSNVPQPMKKSMRDPPAINDAPPMRSSMRSPPPQEVGSQFRSSLRDGPPPKSPLREFSGRPAAAPSTGSPEPRGAPQKKYQPVSAVPITDSYNPVSAAPKAPKSTAAAAATNARNGAPVRAQPVKVVPAPRPLRRQSSDSSFTKARQKTSDSGKISMRRSMRSTSVDERPASMHLPPSADADARSNSLSSNRRPFSTGPSMRTSMRGSTDTASLRGPPATLRGSRAPERSAKPARGSRFSSRFDDSSDEDGDAGKYRSRFDDSSDDDDDDAVDGEPTPPTRLAPIRGIPKRTDEGDDSADLDDSDAERQAPAPPKLRSLTTKTPAPSSAKPGKAEGAALASGSLRHASDDGNLRGTASAQHPRPSLAPADGQKKGSFFGRFGRKKADMPSIPEADDAVQTPSPRAPGGKAGKLLGGLDNSPVATGAAASPKSPKLQRRQTPQRFASDSWPLPEGNEKGKVGGGGGRPSTSDGRVVIAGRLNGAAVRNAAVAAGGGHGRPKFEAKSSFKRGGRVGRGADEDGGPGEAVAGKGGKKKRFPGLRKVFGLHD